MSSWQGFFDALEKLASTDRIPIIREELLLPPLPIQAELPAPPEMLVPAIAADVA